MKQYIFIWELVDLFEERVVDQRCHNVQAESFYFFLFFFFFFAKSNLIYITYTNLDATLMAHVNFKLIKKIKPNC